MGKEILTNKFNLPETLVKAVQRDTHVNTGTISVTMLIDAPQIRILKSKHDYEVDVSEKIYALMGTALHNILERGHIEEYRKKAFITTAETLMIKAEEIEGTAADKAEQLRQVGDYLFKLIPILFPEIGNRYLFEMNFTLTYDKDVISGTLDLYDQIDRVLWDYKFCSVFSYMYPESRSKWDEQTNIYALMLINNGKPVDAIKIVAFFRDWDQYGKMRDKAYPDRQILEIPVALRPLDKIEGRIMMHLQRHRAADAGQNIECSGKERWATADEYAVMIPGGKRALSVQVTEKLAEAYISSSGHKRKSEMFIEKRPGESKRCDKYCPVSKLCPQYAAELASRKKDTPEFQEIKGGNTPITQ